MERGVRGDRRSDLPVGEGLPRRLYWIIGGLMIWLVASVWGFGGPGYVVVVLVVVSLFIAVVGGLLLVMASIAGRRRPRRVDGIGAMSIRDWLRSEFTSYTGQIKSSAAMTELLLPLAAVAFGMTLFAIVHRLVVGA